MSTPNQDQQFDTNHDNSSSLPTFTVAAAGSSSGSKDDIILALKQENDSLRSSSVTLKQQLSSCKIENEKNLSLFQMFDQKMKEV